MRYHLSLSRNSCLAVDCCVQRRTVGEKKLIFIQRNMRIFTIFWWKSLNNLVRIHSAMYRWAIQANMIGEITGS
jgi:hypothetical protein